MIKEKLPTGKKEVGHSWNVSMNYCPGLTGKVNQKVLP